MLRTYTYNKLKQNRNKEIPMAQQSQLSKNIYELIENDNGEIMLILYAGETEPNKASFRINNARKCLELYRNPKDIVIIEGLEAESINKLEKIEILYVCEMKYNETPDSENEIIYAYAVQPQKEDIKSAEKQSKTPSTPTLTEKAQKAREKVLKKEG